MRVRKVCPECKKLKLMLDFDSSEITIDKKSVNCKGCISEKEYKNNNKPLKTEIMSTLAEKRKEAAAAAAALVATPAAAPVKEKAPKVIKEKAPVVEKVEAPEAVDAEGNPADTSGEPAPKVEKTPKAPKVEKTPKAPKAPKVEKVKVVKVKKQIEQIDLVTGEVIKKFLTVDLAAAAVGKHTKYIDIAGKGLSKQAYGFGWRYEGLEEAVKAPEVAAETIEPGTSVEETERVEEEAAEETEE